MNRIVKLTILIGVALVTLAVLFAIYNPIFLEDSWLWLIGLSGTVIVYVREIINSIKRFIPKPNNNEDE